MQNISKRNIIDVLDRMHEIFVKKIEDAQEKKVYRYNL